MLSGVNEGSRTYSVQEQEGIDSFGKLTGRTAGFVTATTVALAPILYLATLTGAIAGCRLLPDAKEDHSCGIAGKKNYALGHSMFLDREGLVFWTSKDVCLGKNAYRNACYTATGLGASAFVVAGVVLVLCVHMRRLHPRQLVDSYIWEGPAQIGESMGQFAARRYYDIKHAFWGLRSSGGSEA